MTTTNNPKTIGILGGGQLGMMLAAAALPLGYRCVFLEDATPAPAALYGQVFKTSQLDEFIQASDVFTLEFENTPLDITHKLQQTNKGLYPPAQALEIAQDRLNEKSLFNQLDIATVPFVAVHTLDDIHQAMDRLGLPLVLKTSRGGYDGKGQFVLKSADQIQTAWDELGDATKHAPLIAEGFIHFSREVSIIAVRNQDGDIRYYPLVENVHTQGILSKTTAPAPNVEALTEQAQSNIKKLLEHLNYVGVMALELFVTDTGLLANEIAPRVHNSGHWSIEGAHCSQFENHIRAVTGLPLGDTSICHPSVMLNIIGKYPDVKALLALDGVHYHSYHKTERDGRKIAHVTVMTGDEQQTQTVAQTESLLVNQ